MITTRTSGRHGPAAAAVRRRGAGFSRVIEDMGHANCEHREVYPDYAESVECMAPSHRMKRRKSQGGDTEEVAKTSKKIKKYVKPTCEHGQERSKCKECGGASICEHGRRRSECKDCGGASICEHGRLRSTCKEFGGGSSCEHGRRRSICKECGGASSCEHGRRGSGCKECRPRGARVLSLRRFTLLAAQQGGEAAGRQCSP